MDLNAQSWHREDERGAFKVSTNLDLLDRDFINEAFGTKDMFWAWSLPKEQLELALKQSTTVALYEVLPAAPPPMTADEPSSPRDESPALEAAPKESLKQIGLARLVTDHVTFAYLSDVYVVPEKRGLGLFKWLISCVKILLDAHPALRRTVLFTGDSGLRDYYAKELGVWDMKEKEPKVILMSKKGF